MPFGIERVEFHKLQDKCACRGAIATFHLTEDAHWEYVQHKALTFLWRLTSMLSENYGIRTYEETTPSISYFSEGNECWITPGVLDEEIYQIKVTHKYWTDKTVECFKNMILALAKSHGWKVEGIKGSKLAGLYQYRNLPMTESGWYVGGCDELGGAGVLEWCFDRKDAENMASDMIQYAQFSNLGVYKWKG